MQPLVEAARKLYEQEKSTYKDTEVANKGLLFDRFFDGYTRQFDIEKGADNECLYDLEGRCGNEVQLDSAAYRRTQLITALQGEAGVFNTDWHFVTGMGNSHPAENGFAWHHSLGTPYLPGSSVKGLLRAWIEFWSVEDGETKEQRKEKILSWFGGESTESNKQGKAGDLIFFDAIPIKRPKLMLDIMTPHMGQWYESGGETINENTIPGDWHSPVPVSFLVTSEAKFLFSIAPRNEAGKAYVKEAMEQLKEALKWLGSGAKTAAGYGHMSYDENCTLSIGKTKDQREAERISASLESAGIDFGNEVWENAKITNMNPSTGEITILAPHTDQKPLIERRLSELSDKAKKRLKRGKHVLVRVEVDRLGNQVKIITLKEIDDAT